MRVIQIASSISVPVVEAIFDEFLKNNIAALGWGNCKGICEALNAPKFAYA